MGQAALGMGTGVRLAQGESVSIFYKPNQPPLPCKVHRYYRVWSLTCPIYQIDGEPWLQTDPVHMQITRGPSLRVLTVRGK